MDTKFEIGDRVFVADENVNNVCGQYEIEKIVVAKCGIAYGMTGHRDYSYSEESCFTTFADAKARLVAVCRERMNAALEQLEQLKEN